MTIWSFTTTGRFWIACMPRMPDCGGFRIGVESSEPNTPPLVMVNVPPLSSWSASFPSRVAVARRLISASIFGERHLLDVAEHRHGQAAIGADGDAKVHVVVIDDVVAVDLGVDALEFLQRQHDRAGEEAHEAQPDAVDLLEALLVLACAGP